MTQVDRVTADLRSKQAAEDEAEEKYAVYSEQAIEEIVDAILDGETIKVGSGNWSFDDFVSPDDIYADDFETLVLCDEDARYDVVKRLKDQCARLVRYWCTDNEYGQMAVADCISKLDEAQRERMGK